jgi:prevent-host-death family protein
MAGERRPGIRHPRLLKSRDNPLDGIAHHVHDDLEVKDTPGLGIRWGEDRTMRLNVVELRQSLAEILNRAEYQGERIIIHRRGKDVAAIVPLEDLKLLERLIEEVEDRLDVEAARVSMAESEDRIPYAEVRRRLGLEDEQKAKRKRAQSRAKTI